jgi:hypothetical protein
MLVLLVPTPKILAVKAGTSIDPAHLPDPARLICFVPETSTLAEVDFYALSVIIYILLSIAKVKVTIKLRVKVKLKVKFKVKLKVKVNLLLLDITFFHRKR